MPYWWFWVLVSEIVTCFDGFEPVVVFMETYLIDSSEEEVENGENELKLIGGKGENKSEDD